LPVVSTDEYLKQTPSDSLQFIWLGHSTVLLEFDGKRFLFDPVFSKRASFEQWAGPKRFQPIPVNIDELPEFDAVFISHNHYDHLDKFAIRKLSGRKTSFYVPLGIRKLVEEWSVSTSNIKELDWWDEEQESNIKVISTPARHFSGRGLFDMNETQWCSWVLANDSTRIYFSGDTGIMPIFKEIGDKYGPFDITFLKIGAYDELWHDVHLNPEEAVDAHKQLRGKTLVPIHWATFDLGLHSWYEPADRLEKAAKLSEIKILTPKIGEPVNPSAFHNSFWWKECK